MSKFHCWQENSAPSEPKSNKQIPPAATHKEYGNILYPISSNCCMIHWYLCYLCILWIVLMFVNLVCIIIFVESINFETYSYKLWCPGALFITNLISNIIVTNRSCNWNGALDNKNHLIHPLSTLKMLINYLFFFFE